MRDLPIFLKLLENTRDDRSFFPMFLIFHFFILLSSFWGENGPILWETQGICFSSADKIG